MSDLKINIFAAILIPWAACSLAMIGRIAARRMTKATWWYEDYFCVAAYVAACCYNSLLLYWTTNWSLGQNMPDSLSEASREHILTIARKMAFFSSLTYSFSIAFSKMTVLSLYWRIFKHSAIRIPIIVLFVISVIWILLRTFMISFRCWPVPYYWDKSITGKCHINDSAFFYGTLLLHFVMDIVILILPVVEVFKLRLHLGQKFAVAALFVIGIIVCVASIFVLYESIQSDPNTSQIPHDHAMKYAWGAVEVNVAIASACFPLLRPVFRLIIGSRVLSSYTSRPFSYGTRGHELTSVTVNKGRRGKDAGGMSSTHQLADDEQRLADMPGFDPAAIKDPDRVH
ncbi:hypothetical protein V2G26_007090 [Clonostachys chloroleuca]